MHAQTQVQDRGAVRHYTLAMSLDGDALEPTWTQGDQFVAVATHCAVDPRIDALAFIESHYNVAAPLHLVAPKLIWHTSREVSARVGFPSPTRAFVVDLHGHVHQYLPSGEILPPPAATGWPVGSVDAMVRAHPWGAILWIDLARAVETHLAGLADPDLDTGCIAAGHPSAGSMLPAAGMGATIFEGGQRYACTVVSVSMDFDVVAVKRDLVLETKPGGAGAQFGKYSPSPFSPTEFFERQSDKTWQRKGGQGSYLLLGLRQSTSQRAAH